MSDEAADVGSDEVGVNNNENEEPISSSRALRKRTPASKDRLVETSQPTDRDVDDVGGNSGRSVSKKPRRGSFAPSAVEDEEEDRNERDVVDTRPSKRIASGSGWAVREGKIQRVRLVNFMNHANLVIDLGPSINFITGPNGSGKSAILVGLSMCLGASASFSQRASKLGEFVRVGQSKAVVAVTLSNEGSEAFKRELYGDSITVERSISATGTTKYKFRDAHGRIVTEDRTELIAICDQFNIQVNNPCIIMMQETSRDFLGHSSAKTKYELFERATQVRAVEDFLTELMSVIATASAALSRKKALLPALERQYEVAKKEHDDIVHLKEVKNQMRNMKQQLVWAHVEEREAKVSTLSKQIEERDALVARNQAKIDGFVKALDEKMAEDDKLAAEAEAVSRRNDSLVTDIAAVKDVIFELSESKESATRFLRAVPAKKNGFMERLAKLEKAFLIAQKDALGDRVAEEAERVQKLNQARAAFTELEREAMVLTEHDTVARSKLDIARKTAMNVAGQVSGKDKDIARLNDELKKVEASVKDEAGIWGPELPKVRDLVARNSHLFRVKPLGPLGSFIKLRQPEGANFEVGLAIEVIVSKVLATFWCDSYEDEAALQNLIHENHLPRIKTYVAHIPEQMYPGVQVPRDSKDFVRALDCIECSSGVVRNLLIDTCQINGCVVARASQDQTKMVNGILATDTAIHRIIFSDASQVTRQRGNGFSSRDGDSNMRATLSRPKNQKEIVLRKLDEAKREREVIMQDKINADEQVRQLEHEVNELKARLFQKQKLVQQERDRVRDLDKPLTGALDTGMTDLEKKRQDLQNSLDELKSKEQEHLKKIATVDAELVVHNAKLQQLQKELDDSIARSGGVQDAAKALKRKLAEDKRKVEEHKKKTAEFIKVSDNMKLELEESKKHLEEGLAAAAKVFPERVPVTMTVQQLENKIAGMERALERQQQQQGKSVEQIEQHYFASFKKLKKVKKRLNWLEETLEHLAAALNKRRKKLERLRKQIGEQVSMWFNTYLTQKGYEGKAQFTHDAENPKLEVTVNLNPASQTQASQDALTLSGGETSFSTVALLLALWESVDTPFRILDEFDIYMDAVHRQLSIMMLIEFARSSGSGGQFIFLSPLETQGIPRADDVKIHRLEPPQRGGQRSILEVGVRRE